MSGLNPSLGVLWHGQMILERHKQIAVPYTQQMMDKVSAEALVGQPYTEVTPKDRDAAEVKVFGPIDLSAFFLVYPGIERRMRLPDVLTSLTCAFEHGGGSTDYNEVNINTGSGNFSVGVSLRGQAQASAYCIPKLVPNMRETWSFNPPVQHAFFYLQGAKTITQVLAILTAGFGATVLAWPVFKPESITMTLVGSRVNATAQASYQGSDSVHSGGGSTSTSEGLGKGVEHSPIIEIQHIPPSLHGAITISPSTDGQQHTASTNIAATGVINGGAPGSNTATAAASVSPTSIAATSPANLPSSGLYMFDLEIEPSEIYGNYFAHAIVFDFATIAP